MEEKYTRRDYLARDRTHLANERTLLAYWRTALAFFLLGAGLIKFLNTAEYTILAFFSLFLGITLFIFGGCKYLINKKTINKR